MDSCAKPLENGLKKGILQRQLIDFDAMTLWEQIQTDAENESIYRLNHRNLLPRELGDSLRRMASYGELSDGTSKDGGNGSEGNGGKQSHPESVLSAVRQTVEGLEKADEGSLDGVLNLAISIEYLDWLKIPASGVDPKEAASIASLLEQSESVVSRWTESGLLQDNPSAQARSVARELIEGLQSAQRLANDRLFVRPEVEVAVQSDRKDLLKETTDLKNRETELVSMWTKVEENLKRLGITGEPGADKAVRERLSKEASEQGADGKAGQALAKLSDLENRRKDVAGRARQLLDEESRLREEASRREDALSVKSRVSQLDMLRTSVIPGYDASNIDADEVKQARSVLSGKLNSLDEGLQNASEKISEECMEASNRSVNPLFVCLNRVWRLNQRKEYHAILDRQDLCEFVFKTGSLYTEIVSELQEMIQSLEALLEEHARQVQAVQEIKSLVKKGAVSQAEKRMTKIERKFKGVSYRRCDEAIQEATRPLREAKRVSSEVDDYMAKRKGFMGKLFKDKDTRRKLDSEISRLRSEAASIPKGELRNSVSDLCQQMESTLKAS